MIMLWITWLKKGHCNVLQKESFHMYVQFYTDYDMKLFFFFLDVKKQAIKCIVFFFPNDS